jgi:hypothetical protein
MRISLFLRLFAVLAVLAPVVGVVAAEPTRGQLVYEQKCAKCHGPQGEGTSDYSEPLIGDKPVIDLVRVIEKTMPEDKPEACVGEEAKAVAEYIYDAFYSPVAQARNRPARIELSRLTVRQYRQATTDLIASFRGTFQWGEERGLRGEYFTDRRFRTRGLERREEVVRLQFGSEPVLKDLLKDAEEYSARWQGSLLAPETGDYEIIVRTENGMRLWLNNNTQPLMDRWVKSGSDTEFRESIWLQGGRVYPIKLEIFKAKNEKTASIELAWKRPHHTDETIAARFLSPQTNPEVFLVTTPFPPDDRSVGYERGTSVSKSWAVATTDGAIETAAYVSERLPQFLGVRGETRGGSGGNDSSEDLKNKAREFCRKFVERAFRQPLTPEQQRLYIDQQFEAAADVETAVKRVVLLTMKSPRFLYHQIDGEPNNPYHVAARLSFGMWDSLPDAELLRAAAAGELATREQVAQQAERMASDLRAQAKLNVFFEQWLRLDHLTELAKDSELYGDFTPEIISDLRTSLELLVDEVLTSPDPDFRRLLTTDEIYLNARLANFYHAETKDLAEGAFGKVRFEPEHRAGVLTHPYLMAGFSYTSTTSPIHRGVFVARSLLGRALKTPPIAVSPLAPDLHPNLTTRDRIALQTKEETCQSCHAMINPLGFALENFDAVGRYRTQEKGQPLDVAGSYLTRAGETREFRGARGLAEFLAASDEVHAAVVEQMFHFLVKQPIRAYGPETLPQLTKSFVEHNFSLRQLTVDIMAASALPNATHTP